MPLQGILNHWTTRGVPQLEFIEFAEKDIGKCLMIRLLTKSFEVAKSASEKRENGIRKRRLKIVHSHLSLYVNIAKS